MEEKTQRIAEVLLRSITPFQFMMGKLLSSILVALTTTSVYVIGIVMVVQRMEYQHYVPYQILPWFFVYLILAIVMLGSIALALFRYVPLKMLPFDNKNEFQIVLDMPEGTPLEATVRVVRIFEDYLRQVPEVTNFVSYTGTSSPMDFNGLVRHYYLRQGGHVADIRVNLADKKRREGQSHEIVLRLRKDLENIAIDNGALIKVVEVPPGPPVVSTLVAEIYGTPDHFYQQSARICRSP